MYVCECNNIVENDVKCIGIDYNDDEKESNYSTDDEVSDNALESADEINEQKSNTEKNNTLSLHQPLEQCKDDKNKELKIPRRSTRYKKSLIKYPENSSNNIYVNFCRVDIYTPIYLRRRWIVKIGKIG